MGVWVVLVHVLFMAPAERYPHTVDDIVSLLDCLSIAVEVAGHDQDFPFPP